MRESEFHELSGITLVISNPSNGTQVLMQVPPGQRTGALRLQGPFGERGITLYLETDPTCASDEDLIVTVTNRRETSGEGVEALHAVGKGALLAEAGGGKVKEMEMRLAEKDAVLATARIEWEREMEMRLSEGKAKWAKEMEGVREQWIAAAKEEILAAQKDEIITQAKREIAEAATLVEKKVADAMEESLAEKRELAERGEKSEKPEKPEPAEKTPAASKKQRGT